MDKFTPALAHGTLNPVFEDIFVVSGAMESVLHDMDWQFSRNMTVVREGQRLILINTVRLDEAGLAALEHLGTVTDVVRIGALHGRDDAFYVDRYDAQYWTIPGLEPEGELTAKTLGVDGLPITGASLFTFETTQLPEGILRIDREGGIAVACDALQNWLQADDFFSDGSRELMQNMGFFTPANIGPVWMQFADPKAEDFARLKTLQFNHALCGHGQPLRDTAQADYHATFNRLFGI